STSDLERPCNTIPQQRNLKPVLQRPVETTPAKPSFATSKECQPSVDLLAVQSNSGSEVGSGAGRQPILIYTYCRGFRRNFIFVCWLCLSATRSARLSSWHASILDRRPAKAAVKEVVVNALKIVKAAGKPAGILTPDQTHAWQYLDLGVNFVAVGSDMNTITSGLRGLHGAFLISSVRACGNAMRHREQPRMGETNDCSDLARGRAS
ncbi:MAG: hypothetical protein KUG58_00550, partial [Marinosulfonomonas sp.]|nr:hypothetical protein [Marinosulfonomonas sp.]